MTNPITRDISDGGLMGRLMGGMASWDAEHERLDKWRRQRGITNEEWRDIKDVATRQHCDQAPYLKNLDRMIGDHDIAKLLELEE